MSFSLSDRTHATFTSEDIPFIEEDWVDSEPTKPVFKYVLGSSM